MDCSVIVDCASKTTIIRVPHELAVPMIYNTNSEELINKLKIASSRSSILRKLISEHIENQNEN